MRDRVSDRKLNLGRQDHPVLVHLRTVLRDARAVATEERAPKRANSLFKKNATIAVHGQGDSYYRQHFLALAPAVFSKGSPARVAHVSIRSHKISAPSTKCAACARDAKGRIARSKVAVQAFKKAIPVPEPARGWLSTIPFCSKRGGADDPSNMQWQTAAEAKAKDKIE